jgi:thiosulfate dehydrogenase [quinone] large subunit
MGATAIGLIGAGLAAAIGRAVGGAPTAPPSSVTLTAPSPGRSAPTTAVPAGTSGTTTTTQPKPAGTDVGAARDVPVGGAATFQAPKSGDPALILQPEPGHFVAYDAVCPHAGCTVGYSRAANLLVCPCHGSQFDPTTGAVRVGPASRGLGRLVVAEGSDGQLYVQ